MDDVINRNKEIRNKDGKIEGHQFGLRKGEGNFLLLDHTAMPIKMGEKCKEKMGKK